MLMTSGGAIGADMMWERRHRAVLLVERDVIDMSRSDGT